jgi:diguanylate cyclase (GGDEF)-like protein/PAS domain S-box-containing protein
MVTAVWRRAGIMTAGLSLTFLLLFIASFAAQKLPVPDGAMLADAYWQQHGVSSSGGVFGSQLGLMVHMLMHVWLLWLVPLAGLLITLVLVNREVDTGEMAVYLERIHLLENALTDSRNAAELYTSRWETLNTKFDQMFENSAEIWLVLDRGGSIRRWNRSAVDLARRFHPGVTDTLEGRPLSDVINSNDLNSVLNPVRLAMASGNVSNGEVHLPTVGQHFLAWIFPLGDEVAVVLRDITHRYREGAFLQSAERLVRQLVEDSVRPVAVLDPNWNYLYVSRKWSEIMGLDPRDTLVGNDHRLKVPDFPAERRIFEPQLAEGQRVGRDDERRTVNGREVILSWHIRPWMDAFGRLGGYIFTVVDNTESARLKQQVSQAVERENALAYSDALTGLPNRQLFNDRLNMSLAQAYRQLGKVALFFLDLDGFKAVNDQLGHDSGDLLLKQVAERLKTCVRTTDTVARLGGDEFTIILSVRDRADAEQVAAKVLSTIRAPYDLNGKIADKVGTSIGIAMYPQDGTQGAELVRKADGAMYAAKQGGKNAWRFATQEIVVKV